MLPKVRKPAAKPSNKYEDTPSCVVNSKPSSDFALWVVNKPTNMEIGKGQKMDMRSSGGEVASGRLAQYEDTAMSVVRRTAKIGTRQDGIGTTG